MRAAAVATLVLAGCSPFGSGEARLVDPSAGCGAPRGAVRPIPPPRWVARSEHRNPPPAPDAERVEPRWASREPKRRGGCLFCDYTEKEVEPVRRLAFTADGRRLVVAGDQHLVTVWDLEAGSPISVLEPNSSGLFLFVQAISPDGRFVTQRAKDALELWDTGTRTRAHALGGHRKRCDFCEAVDSAAFDPTGALVATGDDKGALRIWGSADGRLLRAFGLGHGEVNALAFSPDRKLIATASDDEAGVRLLDVETGELFGVLPTDEDELQHVVWSADGRRLAAADFSKTAVVWDLERCRPVRPRDRPRDVNGWAGFMTGLALGPRGDLLVGAFGDDGLAIWSTSTGALVQRIEPLEDDSINEIAISPGGELLAAGTALGTVLWRLPTLEPLVLLAQGTAHEASYVVDLARPPIVVDVFGRPAEPWPVFAGHFEAFGGSEALLRCRRGGGETAVSQACAERHAVAGLLPRRLRGEDLVPASSEDGP